MHRANIIPCTKLKIEAQSALIGISYYITHEEETACMKESSIYKLFSAVIAVTIFILCGFQEKEGVNTNFINIPFSQIPKLDDVAYVQDLLHDVNFTVLFVVSIAMLAFAGLFQGRKRPPDSVKPKESRAAYLFINQHKLPYDVDLYATVADLKQKIGDRIGSDAIDNQYLIFSGKRLSDNKKLVDYNIQMHSTLFMSGRILGGSRQPARFCAGGRQSRGRGRGRSPGRGRGQGRPPPVEGRANRSAGRSDRVGRENNRSLIGVGGQQNGGRDNDKSVDRRRENVSQKFSEDEVLFYGLLYAGFNEARQKSVSNDKNIERFKCFYGVGYKAVAALIKDLPEKKIELKNLFLALNHLKTYNTETVLSGWWGMSEDTVRKWTRHYQKEIQGLKEKKVSCMVLFGLLCVFISIICSLTFNLFR
jgi:hypothetical protein